MSNAGIVVSWDISRDTVGDHSREARRASHNAGVNLVGALTFFGILPVIPIRIDSCWYQGLINTKCGRTVLSVDLHGLLEYNNVGDGSVGVVFSDCCITIGKLIENNCWYGCDQSHGWRVHCFQQLRCESCIETQPTGRLYKNEWHCTVRQKNRSKGQFV
ncbi:hypothetical protein GJ496_005101 [Pomphorhynchus laevis]|nr:hypothetical protein GJ496_005101 [Pomphorhynchus laevis]